MAGGQDTGAVEAPGVGGRRLGRVPVALVLTVVAVVVAVLRLRAALVVHEVWGAMPDSAGYRAADGAAAADLVSLTGDDLRPWTVPAFYAVLGSDGVRAAGQLVVSIAAWTVLAAVVARQVVRPVVATLGFVAVLVVSCSWGVIAWDLAILAESLALSLGVGLVAAWIAHLRRPSWATAAAVVGLSGLWLFTRLQHLPIVVGSLVLAAVLLGRPDARAVRIATASGLAVVALWGVATLGRQDDGYSARDGHGVSLFGETFALNLRFVILPDPEATAWFRAHGMPEPVDLTPYRRDGTIHEDAWETWPDFFDRYRADADLRAWVESDGRRTYTAYVLQHGDHLAGRFAGDLGEVLMPPESALGYAFPEPILPAPVAAVVAPSADEGLPSPVVLLAVALPVTLAARRRWFPNPVLAGVGAAVALGSIAGLGLAWLGSPVEYARHAVPFTPGLLLGLVLLLLAAWDDVGSPRSAGSAGRRRSGRRRGDRGGRPPLVVEEPVGDPDARRTGEVQTVGS